MTVGEVVVAFAFWSRLTVIYWALSSDKRMGSALTASVKLFCFLLELSWLVGAWLPIDYFY